MTDTTPAASPPLRQRQTEEAAPPGDFATPMPRNGGGAWSGLRPLLLRLHFYAGVLIGPFLLVAAVTGLLYTATPQIESVVYHHELKVTPRGEPKPLAAQVDAAREAIPGGQLVSVTKGAGDSDTTRVTFNVEGLPEGYTQTAFVDPYDAKVRGTLRTFGEWLPVRSWFDSLHRTLHLGEFGRNYSEIAASWLWVEVLGGLALWLGAPRGRERLRTWFVPRRGPKGRKRTLSWHGAVGLWVSAGFLALSATGLTWSAHAGVNIGKIQDSLGGAAPSVSSTLGGAGAEQPAPDASASQVDFDGAVRIARAEGLRGKLVISPPADGKSAYIVKENTRHWPEQQDSVAIDPATGKVMDKLVFDDFPVLAKLTRWGIDAHMGLLFGLANQIALAVIALALVGMLFWGYRMWWLRRPTRGGGTRLGRPPVRGAWRRVPGRVMAPLVVVTAVVAYYLPLFGLPLVCFLLADLAIAQLRRRERTRTEARTEKPKEMAR
ncbi:MULTISPECIES: PepSY-associated TM helix domain-containing protein [unclassified Streptomyces]|uniref:PepSY-associated TM helix domain-containing protein n=1 Tax=unclassified Streptomyces TaxID=2593676 RepID=UPI002E285D33|nr:PepSY-associated TM helix domain-containing protein [Streptomyces sp. NBC_01423]WSX92250.1 PepSY domain-containing protein [Streptomyces sp. NBC_00891]WSY06728.1 PepSY domain-containing protein [Streptomyces sp. NBC_00890]WSZ08353.1 PepSY domain-containing protein [Streptomyces sp. NBC_00869]WSZ24149.1 PepSY domain-containing protein [Streptomyces sp. NBC_00870]